MRWFRRLVIPCFVVLVICGLCSYARLQQSNVEQVPQVATPRHIKPAAAKLPLMSLHPSVPTQLSISKLGVQAPVEPVGINKLGEMEDPRNATDATWYSFGYLPGAFGNAVIAGHYLYESKPALFYRLHELVAGDTITIHNDLGNALEFRVTTSEHVLADAAPYDDIFGPSKQAQLRLVTCFGKWDTARQRYQERLVVTATFVRETAPQ